MTDYSPPLENLPIFDSSLFKTGDNLLTQDQGDKRYLRYPNAQGTENLKAIVVNGTSQFNAKSTMSSDTIVTLLDISRTSGYTNSGLTMTNAGISQTLSTLISNNFNNIIMNTGRNLNMNGGGLYFYSQNGTGNNLNQINTLSDYKWINTVGGISTDLLVLNNTTGLTINSNLLLTNQLSLTSATSQISLNDGTNTNTITPTSITTSDTFNVKSTLGSINLTSPTGSIYANKTTPLTGDCNIYANFIGNLTGTASNSSNIQINTTNANSIHYLSFTDNVSTTFQNLQASSGIKCNPRDDSITCNSFIGPSTSTVSVDLISDDTFGTYYIPFSKSTAGTAKPLYIDDSLTGMTYNPNISTLNCTNFNGLATSSNTITINANNTTSTCYIVFSSTGNGTSKQLFVDELTNPLTYNPGTSTVTATTFNGLCTTTGLVYIKNITGTITGAATATTFTLPTIFNTTYKNYRIVFSFGLTNTATIYPALSLNGFLGTSTPTIADLYGYDMTSGTLIPVSITGATLATTPLQITGGAFPNSFITLEVTNVGYSTTNTNNVVTIVSNSIYYNAIVKGIRNIQVIAIPGSVSTITGLSLQSILGVGNNPTWNASIYGYK